MPRKIRQFSQRSLNNLKGVDSRLVVVASLALNQSPFDFIVTEGLRTKARQVQLKKQGKTRTLRSRHLTGHSIDIAVLTRAKKVTWEFAYYQQVADKFKEIAAAHGIPIEWGGDWKSFKDGVHFQIRRGKSR